MSNTGVISLFLIIANLFFSYKGFKDEAFFERYEFEVDKVLINRDYKRLVTAGFLHLSWTHLIFNMLSLYFFSSVVELVLGDWGYLLVYFASLVAGNLFSLFIHRHHGDYSAAGASGAICGIIFASIALFPQMRIGLFFLPAIPAWLYGLIYVLYSIYGIRSKTDNIGHDAHLGGALIGMLLAIAMHPSALSENLVPILVVTLPCLFFIYVIVNKPHLLLIDNNFYKQQQKFYSIDHKYNAEKNARQKDIDAILEKIHRKGMNSLTRKERELLDQYSKTVR